MVPEILVSISTSTLRSASKPCERSHRSWDFQAPIPRTLVKTWPLLGLEDREDHLVARPPSFRGATQKQRRKQVGPCDRGFNVRTILFDPAPYLPPPTRLSISRSLPRQRRSKPASGRHSV